MESLKCPLLRAARLAHAMCTIDGYGASNCDPSRDFAKHLPTALEKGENGLCPTVMQTPVKELQFSFVPNTTLSR